MPCNHIFSIILIFIMHQYHRLFKTKLLTFSVLVPTDIDLNNNICIIIKYKLYFIGNINIIVTIMSPMN